MSGDFYVPPRLSTSGEFIFSRRWFLKWEIDKTNLNVYNNDEREKDSNGWNEIPFMKLYNTVNKLSMYYYIK